VQDEIIRSQRDSIMKRIANYKIWSTISDMYLTDNYDICVELLHQRITKECHYYIV